MVSKETKFEVNFISDVDWLIVETKYSVISYGVDLLLEYSRF
jgi:hypothetical protein